MMAFVQARMGSSRLPGKALVDIAGRPMLFRVIERLGLAKQVSGVVVTTSTQDRDSEIEDACQIWGVDCFRGPENDVLERLILAAKRYKAMNIIRISGDSPLIDPRIVDFAIRIHGFKRDTDLVTNVFPRTFPAGQSVEVLSLDAMSRIRALSSEQDREHVTRAVYRNPLQFSIVSFTNGAPLGSKSHAVDTRDDLSRVVKLFEAFASLPESFVEISAAINALDGAES